MKTRYGENQLYLVIHRHDCLRVPCVRSNYNVPDIDPLYVIGSVRLNKPSLATPFHLSSIMYATTMGLIQDAD